MRPTILASLFTDIRCIKGVGPHLADCFICLTKRESPVWRDVLFHLPNGIIDRRSSPPINHALDGKVATFEITIAEHAPPKSRGKPYRVLGFNPTGQLVLTFFNVKGDYLTRQLQIGKTYVVSGHVERYGSDISMPHPDIIVPVAEKEKVMVVEPVYPLTAGLSNKQITRIIREILQAIPELAEWCDAGLLQQKGWASWKNSIVKAHYPEGENELLYSIFRARLAYDELLANQLALALARSKMKRGAGLSIKASGKMRIAMENALPFRITDGQHNVLEEISIDMASGSRMLRLLQGDVGSGKTVVAMLAMAPVLEAGKQAALMAPTDILARQHASLFKRLLEPVGIKVELLTGKTGTAKEREILRERIAAGEVDIVVGTHALFQESVLFKDLALVVVDEQHRFGVMQRMQLAAKAVIPPHILLMTATPIPRTLTMTVFGDMDSSVLREKPAGRQPVDTRAMPLEKTPDIITALHRAIADGNKIYWICPLVEEADPEKATDEKQDLAAAETRYQSFLAEFNGRVGLVHGRMKPDAREPVMAGFAGGDFDILVATTVIEVGVDVPSATIMVIEHAERFGLSQLHQLRGRVGRGSKKSSCILLYKHPAGEISEQRLNIMRETEDGFRIAEEDLRLRGAGDVLGTKQSGLPDFYFADLVRDKELALTARRDVEHILQCDPDLASARGQALRSLLYLFSYEEQIRLLKVG